MEVIEKEIGKNHARVLEALYGFEDFRKKSYIKKLFFEILAIISPIIGIILLVFFMMNDNLETDFAVWAGFISLIVSIFASVMLVISSQGIHKKFKSKLKNECFKEALKAFGNIEWYENKENDDMQESNVGLNKAVLDRSALFASYNRRFIDDEFKGNYNGVDFKISETNMQHESGSGKNRTVVTVFRGVIVQFNSNKKVLNRTMVSTKGDTMTAKTSTWITISVLLLPFLNIIADSFKDGFNVFSLITPAIILIIFMLLLFCGRKKEEPLDKVTLEDPEFNKRFDVYSSDQVEARYLVTPSFMERLNNLSTAFGTNKVKCSFFDDKFMIAISTNKDLFEIGKINKPLTNPENLETFYSELNSIYQMIDYFKLDEKTGL